MAQETSGGSAEFGPRAIIARKEMLLVGLAATNPDIGQLWGQFSPRESEIRHRVEGAWWEWHVFPDEGAAESSRWVMIGVEVTQAEDVPEGMLAKTVPAGHYAVFPHRPGLGEPNHGYDALNQRIEAWLRTGTYQLAGRFSLQLYDARFRGMEDPESEQDLLIPVEPKG